jgi:hypothetical protein
MAPWRHTAGDKVGRTVSDNLKKRVAGHNNLICIGALLPYISGEIRLDLVF